MICRPPIAWCTVPLAALVLATRHYLRWGWVCWDGSFGPFATDAGRYHVALICLYGESP